MTDPRDIAKRAAETIDGPTQDERSMHEWRDACRELEADLVEVLAAAGHAVERRGVTLDPDWKAKALAFFARHHPTLEPVCAGDVRDGEDVLLIDSRGRVTTIRRYFEDDGLDRVQVLLDQRLGTNLAEQLGRPEGLGFRHSEVTLPIMMRLAPERLLYRVRFAGGERKP